MDAFKSNQQRAVARLRQRFGISEPSRTVLFADNVLVFPANPTGWHRQTPAGQMLLVDGHTEFHTARSVTNMVW